MAARTLLFDDLTNEPDATTLRFSVDERAFEVDLTVEHRKEFDDFVARYIAVARPVGKQPKAKASKPEGPSPAVLRAFARDNGLECAPKGKVPASVLTAFLAAAAPGSSDTTDTGTHTATRPS